MRARSPEFLERVPEPLRIRMARRLIARNHDIEILVPECGRVKAETFPDLALDAISLDGITSGLDRDSEARARGLVRNSKDHARAQAMRFRAREKAQELASTQDAPLSGIRKTH